MWERLGVLQPLLRWERSLGGIHSLGCLGQCFVLAALQPRSVGHGRSWETHQGGLSPPALAARARFKIGAEGERWPPEESWPLPKRRGPLTRSTSNWSNPVLLFLRHCRLKQRG